MLALTLTPLLTPLLVPLLAAPEWTLLAFPRATRAPLAARAEPVLLDAAHLDVEGAFRPPALEISDPPLAPAIFQQMLEETLRARGLRLESRVAADWLLVRGDAPALEAARALVLDLDRQVAALEIDLEVTLRTTGQPDSVWRRRVTSGTESFLGSRATRPFVAGFEVQVAQDAGQAAPRLGSAWSGTGLHLRASRLAGGTRVHVDGVLDVSVITAVESFDPDTVDLGVFEQPRIELVQLAFAGSIDSGAALEVRLTEAGPLRGESTLSVRAIAQPDAAGANDGWALVDLAFTASAPRALVAVDPGLGLVSAPALDEAGTALLTPASLAALIESERPTSDARPGRPVIVWSQTLLALPRADAVRLEAARALVRAAEDVRARTVRATLECGPLKASIPVSSGRPARLVVGVERPFLADYGLEVAPQIWMPSPRSERAFDGLCVDLAEAGGGLSVSAWRTTTPDVVVTTREASQMGMLQLPTRSRVAGAARVVVGEKAPPMLDAGPPLTVGMGAL